jgi:hypothetical protein
MKKKQFNKRLGAVVEEANAFIKEKITIGKKIVFLTKKEIEEELTAIHDVPAISKVGKHGDYTSYGILSVEGKKEGVFINVRSKDEDEKEFEVNLFSLDSAYIEDQDLCYLADLIDQNI